MDYDSLLPRAQKDYKKLEKAIFEDNLLENSKLYYLAARLKIKEWEATMYYSHMLKFHNTPPTANSQQLIANSQQPTCPTCSSTKANAKGCRDYFHII